MRLGNKSTRVSGNSSTTWGTGEAQLPQHPCRDVLWWCENWSASSHFATMNKEPGDWRAATDPWNKYWFLATSRLITEVAGSSRDICYSQMLPSGHRLMYVARNKQADRRMGCARPSRKIRSQPLVSHGQFKRLKTAIFPGLSCSEFYEFSGCSRFLRIPAKLSCIQMVGNKANQSDGIFRKIMLVVSDRQIGS